MRIQFIVHHLPVARPRQRVGVRAGHAVTYTDTKHPVHEFKAAVAAAAAEAIGREVGTPFLDAPAFRVDILFVFPGPVSKAKKPKPKPMSHHTVKPDRDNLDKAVLDALAAFWPDDRRVVEGEVLKRRAGLGAPARCEVIITTLAEHDDATAAARRLGFTLYDGERPIGGLL